MTRPQIIRADTLDLQDKSSPTAKDHSAQPEHPAPLGIGPAAPHQQASLRHVEEERNSEEVRLQNAWSNAGDHVRNDLDSDDERNHINSANGQKQMQQDEQAIRLNGGLSSDGDDSDMQDADVEEDMDDDMMDKISSSPSIDDGGYSLPSPPVLWPRRMQSLTPDSSPVPAPDASSSPFTATPTHFPISLGSARKLFDNPAPDESHVTTSPTRSSLFPIPPPSQNNFKSTEHHRGEYARTRISPEPEDDSEDGSEIDTTMSPRSKMRKVVERRLKFIREDFMASVVSDLDEDQASMMLKPLKCPKTPDLAPDDESDPFVETTASPPRTANGTPPPGNRHPDDETNSWTTDSDADTWDDEPDNDDASDDSLFSDDPRFVDSGWGGECLRETEDIDFEFVYALHTFVATVEGQANATKGDTMVLLDDSNSYWWLVRVVKDSSIGYLPAEHIETPTERLARLNKHRNIDLSATMLGDTAEKSKNPLKKAMRRRNAKTVQFAPPTYVEASDYDYSSDEDNGELFGGPEPKQVQQQQQQQEAQQTETESQEDLKVQPLKVGGGKKDGKGQAEGDARASEEGRRSDDKSRDRSRESEEGSERPLDPKVSRNGTVRNTDSFFKDENTETRKITLTPNLLRDDSSTSTTGSRERGPSLESLEKNGFADKVKDDKKKKEKKAGMLSGLFKRKDKKGKGQLDSNDSDMEKQSEEVDRSSPQPKPSEESAEAPAPEQLAPQRNSSKGKLHKVNRGRDDSPQKTKGILKTESQVEPAARVASPPGTTTASSDQQPSSMRMVPSEDTDAVQPVAEDKALASKNSFNSSQAPQRSDSKPERVKKAKQRMALDDFDSSDEEDDPFADPEASNKAAPPEATVQSGRLSESPVHVSAADAQPSGPREIQVHEREIDPQQPPGLTQDNSSQETSSPVSTPSPDDSPMKTIPENTTVSTFRSENNASPITSAPSFPPPSRPAPVPSKAEQEMHTSPPTSSESTTLPAWSDAALRAYLDDGSDVRDMLLLVNDTTGVTPVGRDHPIMSKLFVEETKTVQGMSNELDRLLSGLMEKRMKRNGSGASKASTARSAAGSAGAMR